MSCVCFLLWWGRIAVPQSPHNRHDKQKAETPFPQQQVKNQEKTSWS